MKFDEDKFVEMYKKKAGNISATCNAMLVSRTHFYRKMKKSKKFKKAIDDAYESIIDNVESKLLSKINDGDTTAIIFYLKTKGKKRGYVEKMELDSTIEVLEPVQLLLPDNGRGR